MNHSQIVSQLLNYVVDASPSAGSSEKIPLDQSLFALGILDSFGVVEMVDFIERKWAIKILDSEINEEKFGGINKMASLISEKLESDAK